MTRGEVTFLFHRKDGTAVKTSCFMNFPSADNIDAMKEQVIEAISDFTEDTIDQFRCVTVVVDVPESKYYLTAMITFDAEGEEWLNMMAAHEAQETIH